MVVTRREGETICIGWDIRITLVVCGREGVWFRVEAPGDLSVSGETVRWYPEERIALVGLWGRIFPPLKIGDDVGVFINRVRGSRAKIAIKAPREMCVDRMEVRIRREVDVLTIVAS